jgi:hypothetical protein
LGGVAEGDLLGGPIHAIGKQHGATQTMIDEPLPSAIEVTNHRLEGGGYNNGL